MKCKGNNNIHTGAVAEQTNDQLEHRESYECPVRLLKSFL